MMSQSISKTKLILLAMVLGASYWVLDSAFSVFILRESGFAKQLFTPAIPEIWRRILGIGFILGCTFLIYISKSKQSGIYISPDAKIEHDTLEVARSFHQAVIDGVAVPIMAIGLDYQVQLMNKAAREFSSLEPAAAKLLKCYQISHQRETPCDGLEHPCPIDQVYRTGQSTILVHKHRQSDGEWRLIEVIASPLREMDGSIQGIIESLYDITERQRSEQAKEQYTERLRTLSTQLSEVADSERSQLARELHDQVGQNLTAIGINLNIIRSYIPEKKSSAELFHLEDSLSLIEQTSERIRDLMADLRPPLLDEYGLIAALQWYGEQFSRRTHIAMTVDGKDPEPRLTTRVENALFSIAKEALTNVAKHAQAKCVTVTMEVMGDSVRLVVADDGVGFPSGQQPKLDGSSGWGLITMTERAESIGGHCLIESSPNQGTRVIIELSR